MQPGRRRPISLFLGTMLALAPLAAAKEPSGDVKRLLFPAQEALGADNLDLAETEAAKALAADPEVTETHLILGEAAWRKGNLAKARASFTRAKELGGASAQADAGLALVALAEDDLAKAETHANAAVAADKGDWLASYALGRVLIAKGQTDAAFKLFEKGKGLKTRADRRDLFEAGMGLVALAERDVDGAQTNFIKARALAPNTVEHTMNLADMYEATEQWGQASSVLEQAELKVGESALLSYRKGHALEKQKQYNEALKQYQKALAADSTFTPAIAAIGHLYLLDTRRTAQAIEILSRAVAKQPTFQSRLDLGIALTRGGKAADAVAHLEAAQQEKDEIPVKVALASAYANAGALDKALPLYADVDVALEAPAADLVGVARELREAKRYDEARTFLDKAAERDPQNSDVHYQRGLIDLANKNFDGAVANLQKKIDADPKNANALMNLGVAYQYLRKNADAVAAFRRATVAAPNAAATWVRLGEALAADSTAAALKAYDRALAVDPESAAAKRGKGYTHLLLEQYPQAISLLLEATTAAPNDVDGWVWLGQAQLNSGKHAEARSSFQRALKLDAQNKPAQEGLQLLSSAGR
jgi:tetratricopeptide (TPR) repeat protein